jgi:4-hydroxythreonine-4-phosphate dehydrogenase
LGVRPLYITEGDPAGVSFELVSKEVSYLKRISNSRAVFFFRSDSNLRYPFAEEIEYSNFINQVSDCIQKKGLYFIRCSRESKEMFQFEIGQPNLDSGLSSYISLQSCLSFIERFPGDLITLPLSKEWVMRSGATEFTGHTEELARFFQTDTFMLMLGKTWKILPLTTHVPIRLVAHELSLVKWKSCLKAILDSNLFPKPIRIAYLGLNPHAGEGGKIGDEEETILWKNLKDWQDSGSVELIGPLSADSAFVKDSPDWDICLACYHDQGLIPFKILEGKNGINLTLGLPFLRVSPDHGPAYDIAGKNIVDSVSFYQCMDFLENKEGWI